MYVHIGQGKTGSTSLQAFLRLNRATLAKHGIAYPDPLKLTAAGNATPAALSLSAEMPAWVRASAPRGSPRGTLFEHFWQELLANASEWPTILTSSEEFECISPALFRKRSRFDGRHKKIVVYVRRQDRVIESLYGQLVHANYTSLSLTDFVDRVLRREGAEYRSYAYYDFLRDWTAEFGRENVTVIVYHRRSEDFIYRSFLETLGLSLTEEYRIPPPQNETRTNVAALEYLRICNKLQLTRLMSAHTQLGHQRLVARICSRWGIQDTRFLLPMHVRVRIMEFFREQNRKTASEYVPTAVPDLFDLDDLANLTCY